MALDDEEDAWRLVAARRGGRRGAIGSIPRAAARARRAATRRYVAPNRPALRCALLSRDGRAGQVVFIVGGATYAEAMVVAQWNAAQKGSSACCVNDHHRMALNARLGSV